MQISFHHANPAAGNESFLLRFDRDTDETPCVLVDAGHGVDLDALLTPDDRLVAICLTHAHLDHYAEIAAAHRDGVPILTTPATAALLGDVFDVAGAEYDVETTSAVTDAITPIEDWTEVAAELEVHPVPAGHVPGAAGFLVRVADGDQSHHLLATGDFTRRSAAGFPGFDAAGFVDVDALFLTGATNDGFEDALTDALGTALEHAHGGAPTLVTTSGLVGVHAAYLLSALGDEFDLRVPIRVVGQVAKLYDALEYNCRGVESVPYFMDTDECLEPGMITIAGPEIPTERSSGRLFGVLKENSNACVVQLVGSGEDPLTTGACTIHDYKLINHPTRETLVDVHDAIDPTQTVITHSHGGAQSEFNDLSSVVWGAGDTDEYTLFDGRSWRLPPWMPGHSVSQHGGRSVQQLAGADLLASFSVPGLDRHDKPDLEAEGVDVDLVATLLHQGPDVAGSPDVPDQDTEHPPNDPDSDQTATSATMPTDSTDKTDSTDSPDHGQPPTGLIRTTTADLGDDLDPALQAALEEGTLTPEDLTAAVEARTQVDEQDTAGVAEDDDSSDPSESTDENDDTRAETTDDSADGGDDDESEALDERSVQTAPKSEAGEASISGAASGDVPTDGTTAPDFGPDVSEAGGEDESATIEVTSAATDGSNGDADMEVRTEPSGGPTSGDEGWSVELNPLAIALVERALSGDNTVTPTDASLEEGIVAAVEEYVLALLAGEASGGVDEQFAVDVTGSRAVDDALAAVVSGDEQVGSTAELVADGLAAALGREATGRREIQGLGGYRQYLDAAVENDAYGFADRDAVIEAALLWFLVKSE